MIRQRMRRFYFWELNLANDPQYRGTTVKRHVVHQGLHVGAGGKRCVS